jgi:hypothetical protein
VVVEGAQLQLGIKELLNEGADGVSLGEPRNLVTELEVL